MAPAAESPSSVMLSPQRNVTFAVNYEVSIVDRFWQQNQSSQHKKKQDSSLVEPGTDSTTDDGNPRSNDGATQTATQPQSGSAEVGGVGDNNFDSTFLENALDLPFPSATRDQTAADPEKTMNTTTDTATAAGMKSASSDGEDSTGSSGSCKENKQQKSVDMKCPVTSERQRRSTREMKKRQAPMERTRVRYDMELVPAVKRNRAFLDKFPLWATPSTTREDKVRAFKMQQLAVTNQQLEKQQQLQQAVQLQQQQQQLALVAQKEKAASIQLSAEQQTGPPPLQRLLKEQPDASASAVGDTSLVAPCERDIAMVECDSSPELIDDDDGLSPFGEDSSVIWVPKKRSEWEDCVFEMTTVCTSASLRRQFATRGKSSSSKPFHAPLSKEYIRDRVDIDDPLNGYQIRHKTGGWLQGFILWTNFTTWTHYFKWDSSHAMSGIPTMSSSSALVDSNGALAAELEQQPRSGDPFEGGVVFEAVAEISLVGGLGCGEYLLRMALESIRSKRKYKFVVLQATDSSKTFYERFGFVRVGAICRYERRDKEAAKPGSRPDTPIMGYRHWTHPNESDTSLQKHGGPSYMMCLKLPKDNENDTIETPFLDAMMKLEVPEKPTIQQLGGSSGSHPKLRRGSLDSSSSVTSAEGQVVRNNVRRKPSKRSRGVNGSPAALAPAMLQSDNSKIQQSAPVLPVLRGSSVANNPARNAACTPNGLEEKINLNPSGVKRVGNTSKGESIAKKRRVIISTPSPAPDDTAQPEGSTQPALPPAEESKASRRPPRDRSNTHPEPATNAISDSSSNTPAALPSSKKKSNPKRSTPRRKSGSTAAPEEPVLPTPAPSPSSAEKNSDASRLGPMKQKVKSYPRDRVHFYNKVVRPKKGKKSENFFVLHYDEAKGTIRIIPMESRGVLSGKRAGRPRFQAVMSNLDRDARTVRCADYDIVKAFMVMKTPVVASEAWDILDA